MVVASDGRTSFLYNLARLPPCFAAKPRSIALQMRYHLSFRLQARGDEVWVQTAQSGRGVKSGGTMRVWSYTTYGLLDTRDDRPLDLVE